MDTLISDSDTYKLGKQLKKVSNDLENAAKILNTTPKAWTSDLSRECVLARELAAWKLHSAASELLMALQNLGYREGINMIYDLADALIDEMDEKKDD